MEPLVVTERTRSPLPTRHATVTAWVFGLLVFGGVVAVMVHFSELQELARLLRSLDPWRLLIAAGIQIGTYFCAAGVWYVALVRKHAPIGLMRLVRLALVLLFTNQAFPSAGVAGSVIVVHALRRQHVPASVATGALVVGFITTQLAYLIAVPLSLVLLRVYHALSIPLLLVTAGCAAIAVGVPALIVWYRKSIAPRLGNRLKRAPTLARLLDAIGRTPTSLLHDRTLLTRGVALQVAELTLDAMTLGVIMAALGVHTSAAAMFGSYVIAAAVSQLVPLPMGLGSFEAVLVTMLRTVGVSLEAAMTATLLLRAFTFWLPMLPGLAFARRELSTGRASDRRAGGPTRQSGRRLTPRPTTHH
jgi:uncharacterized protein (TIRG00374 family)